MFEQGSTRQRPVRRPLRGAVPPADELLGPEQRRAWIAAQTARVGRALTLFTPDADGGPCDGTAEHLDALTRWQRMEDLCWVRQMQATADALSAFASGAHPLLPHGVPRDPDGTVLWAAGDFQLVLDELALALACSPGSVEALAAHAEHAVALPCLLDAVETGLLTRRHAQTVLDVLAEHGCRPTDPQPDPYSDPGADAGTGATGLPLLVQQEVVLVLLSRYTGQRPHELRRMLQRLLRLADAHVPGAADRARERQRAATADRRVVFTDCGDGQASLYATGPTAQIAALRAALNAALDRDDTSERGQTVLVDPLTGEVLQQLTEPTGTHDEQDSERDSERVSSSDSAPAEPRRTKDARRFDMLIALVTGGALRPEHWTVDLLIPYSLTQNGEWELADIPGLGPVLPQTARDLASLAGHTRRITIRADQPDPQNDPKTDAEPSHGAPCDAEPSNTEQPGNLLPDRVDQVGRVLAVDDLTGPLLPPVLLPHDVLQLLHTTQRDQLLADAARALAHKPVVLRDLSSSHYAPSGRLLRLIERRDRTCRFPGCTVPATMTDKDHQQPWPLGATSEDNLHCLCRRHHRAKQSLWDVECLPDGTTLWTSRLTGYTYARPPSGY